MTQKCVHIHHIHAFHANMYLQTSVCIHLLPSAWTTKRLSHFHNRKKLLGKCLSTDRTYKSKPRIDNRREGDMLLHVIACTLDSLILWTPKLPLILPIIPSPPSFSRCCRCLLAGVHILCLWAQAILPVKCCQQQKKEGHGKHRLKHLGRPKQSIPTRHWISQIHLVCPHVCSPLTLAFHWIKLNHWHAKHHEILRLADWHLYQLSQDLNCFSLGQLLFALSRKSIYLVQLDSYGNILNIL